MICNRTLPALLAFAAGIALLQTRADLPTPALCGMLACIATALAWNGCRLRRLNRARPISIACMVICAASAGFIWAALLAHHRLRDRLTPQWEGLDIAVTGTVADLPVSSVRGTRFLFAVESVSPQAGIAPRVPAYLALSWYAGREGTPPPIEPGQRWQFTVRLKRPHGNANPYGFDYELRMLERGVGAGGYVRTGAANAKTAHLLAAFAPSPSHALQRVRAYLRRKVMAALAQAPHAGVILALVIGEQRAIGKDDWAVFRRTGVSHLVAISGLHVMMVAGLFGRLTLASWRRSFWLAAHLPMPLPLYLPAQKAAMLAAVAAAMAYVALAGFGIPAQRALAMLTVVALAFWLGRISNPPQVLGMALGAVLLLDPWALLSPGFHLSFAAVGIILYAGTGRTKMGAASSASSASSVSSISSVFSGIVSGARTQWAVSVGLLPLTLLLFAQYSLISPVANAVAIPAVTLLVVPLALLGVVLPAPLAGFVLGLAHGIFSWVFHWLDWLAALPVAVWRTPVPGWPLFLMASAGTLLLLAPRGWPLRWIGVLGWTPLLLNMPAHPAAGTFWVTVFDVGQGMALLVETARHRMLYDTGPRYGADSDAGQRVILPYLQARGIDRIDALLVSHGDSDHAGGALSLLQAMPVAMIYSSLPRRHPIVAAGRRHRRCVGGQHWQWDGVGFEMLYPPPALYDDGKSSANAHSCVLKVSNGAQSILLPGDIGVMQERQLLAGYGAAGLRASVLLAPHHGSKTSSSGAFLRAVDPRLAVFQVGYRNRFRHPQAKVYRRYGDLGIDRLRTDENGAITLQFSTTVQFQAYRQQYARYWRTPAPKQP